MDSSGALFLSLIVTSGQPYQKGDTPRLISTEEVNQISILHGKSAVISVCGSAAFGLGIEGMLDLCRDGSLIASLYWNGPWKRVGNELNLSDVDDDQYVVNVSIPPYEGILGDLAVEISEVCASDPLQ